MLLFVDAGEPFAVSAPGVAGISSSPVDDNASDDAALPFPFFPGGCGGGDFLVAALVEGALGAGFGGPAVFAGGAVIFFDELLDTSDAEGSETLGRFFAFWGVSKASLSPPPKPLSLPPGDDN